ncbi:MAG: hypothetical protein WBA10_00035, partial [Elainellaceae cyanobacterium]
LLTLCRPLVDRWFAHQLPYGPGQITLIFHSDALSAAADIVMYLPDKGDRVLYTKPHLDPISQPSADPPAFESPSSAPREATVTPLADQEDLIRALSQAFQSSSRPMLSAIAQLTSRIQQLEAVVDSALQRQEGQSSESTQVNVDQQFEAIAQQLSSQQTHLKAQLDAIQAQISDLNLSDLQVDPLSDPPIPQTEAEWRSRIEQTRGTVGDYETYSTAYREMHGDAPLFETPDWVMLCEFDWAQRLCPDLADLYDVLYGTDGVGDEGADVLQQFGAHCRDGSTYYLYQERGYRAEAAMQEIAHHPDYSWLPTLRQLWQRSNPLNHNIFELFGWEADAVAAMAAIAEPPRRHGSYGNGRRSSTAEPAEPPWSQTSTQGRSLLDYQALLNIGPFAPLTAETVKRAYRQAMKTAHPDSGGSTQKAQQINEAYQAVMGHYFPSKT